MFIASPIEANHIAFRIILFAVGMTLGAAGIAFMFRTYISPEVYELIVKEISGKYGFSISKTKTTYDVSSCLLAVILSFAFFGLGHFEGVKVGTIVCAYLNGTLIGFFVNVYDKLWSFKDGLSTESYIYKIMHK